MFFHNLYQWEWTTALALFAPKPLLFANSDDDKIFPMSGNKRIIARLRKCYDLYGAKESVDEHVSKGGHAYRPDLRVAVFSFFHKHLKGDNTPVKDADFPVIEGKELRAFADDKDIPKDAINATADETFVPVAKVELPDAKNFKAWKAGLVKQLRERVFRALPEKVPAAKAITAAPPSVAIYAAEENVHCTYITLKLGQIKKQDDTVVVITAADDLDQESEFWAKREPKSFRSAILPRGVGLERLKWTTKNPPNTVERSLVLLGQTADSGRVRDVASFLAMYAEKDAKVRLVGRGPAGVIAAYAALFAPERVEEVMIADPPTSHRDGPHFLNVMRVLDIPDALGLLAPDIKLTLVGKNAKDQAFDRTAAIYKAAGAGDKFKRE